MVEAHSRSAKHQRVSFHENESSQTFAKHATTDFAHKSQKLSCVYSCMMMYVPYARI